MESDRLHNLTKWIDDHVSIPASAEASAELAAESKLVNDLLLQIHAVDLDPLVEPMLTLDLLLE